MSRSTQQGAALYSLSAPLLDGREQQLAEYRGKVMLIVNVASKCGFTPQYAGLETLWERYRDRGLMVLGFPCNQFGGQEPGAARDIAAFCSLTYGVSFPMFAKVEVNGENAAPLYRLLKQARPGILGLRAIKWNFTKFVVDRDGAVVARHGPRTPPERLAQQIESLL